MFLGLDLSTQQLKAVLISDTSQLIHECAVRFDEDLPYFGTINGALYAPDGAVNSPVRMWLEAVDLLFERMRDAGVNLKAIKALAGAAQQHGSVYWSCDAEHILATLNPGQPLATQLCPCAFALPFAPIWQDSSTTEDCLKLTDQAGGEQALADITGSRAYERFTGPQIAKVRRIHPDAYKNTTRISLVSSFLASLFLAHLAPIDVADASGMNLMDVLTCKWDDRLLEACGGPDLRSKLGSEPVTGGTLLGKVSDWWVRRWGFHPDCMVAPFTGDNPATLLPLSDLGGAILSLGTSTTFLLSVPPSEIPPRRLTTSHLLAHPTTPNAHIAMLCYKNGALAREEVRDLHAGGAWSKFSDLVRASPPGNNGFFGLYFPLPEIIPPNVRGTFFFAKNEGDLRPLSIDEMPATAHPRAILESQFLSIRSHVRAILSPQAQPIKSLILTGGASSNPTVQQVAADVFGLEVFVMKNNGEAAATGGALLAMYTSWKLENEGGTFQSMMDTLRKDRPTKATVVKVAEPDGKESVRLFQQLVETYAACEAYVVQNWNVLNTDPSTAN